MRRILCRVFHWCLLMLEDPAERFAAMGAWTTPRQEPEARTLAHNGSRVLVAIGTAVYLYDLEDERYLRPLVKA